MHVYVYKCIYKYTHTSKYNYLFLGIYAPNFFHFTMCLGDCSIIIQNTFHVFAMVCLFFQLHSIPLYCCIIIHFNLFSTDGIQVVQIVCYYKQFFSKQTCTYIMSPICNFFLKINSKKQECCEIIKPLFLFYDRFFYVF